LGGGEEEAEEGLEGCDEDVEVAVEAFSVALDDCFDEPVEGRVDAAAAAAAE
jgi:hypothetical protein